MRGGESEGEKRTQEVQTQVTGIPLALYQRQCWVRFPYKHSRAAERGSNPGDHRANPAYVFSDSLPLQRLHNRAVKEKKNWGNV